MMYDVTWCNLMTNNTSHPVLIVCTTSLSVYMSVFYICVLYVCQAMKLLYETRDNMDDSKGSPLELWIKKHGGRTLQKFKVVQSIRFACLCKRKVYLMKGYLVITGILNCMCTKCFSTYRISSISSIT